MRLFSLFPPIFLLLLASCSENIAQSGKELKSTAARLNKTLAGVRETNSIMAAEVAKLYEKSLSENVDPDSLDVSNGGSFRFFNNTYLTFSNTGGPSVLIWDARYGYLKAGDDLKKYTVRMLNLSNTIKELMRPLDFAKLFIGNCSKDYLVAIGYPYQDWASLAPNTKVIFEAVGKDFRNLPFCAPANPKSDPERKNLWIPDIFVSMDVGVLFESIAPVVLKNQDAQSFMNTTIDILVESFNNRFLFSDPRNLLLLTSTGNVFGASKNAISNLGVIYPTFYYLKTKVNATTIGDTYKIQKNADPGFGEIWLKVQSGERKFSSVIRGRSYTVLVEEVPEIKGWLLGLTEKK